MEVVNNTRYPCSVVQAIEADGRRFAVVMVKATYRFPQSNAGRPRPSDEQRPILFCDRFEGEPGFSAPLEESDVVQGKPRCDVTFNACAHAPYGQPVQKLEVSVKVGEMEKHLQVIGDRVFEDSLLGLTASAPQMFTRIPLTYDRAFGGTWVDEAREKVVAWEENPVGCGYATDRWTVKQLEGTPLPNLSLPGETINSYSRKQRTVALGPIGRSWRPRVQYAGTYDEHWTNEIFPLPPKDLDPQFFQCAPEDQQIPYPRGGEAVVLCNLNPDRPQIRFNLPQLVLPVHLVDMQYEIHTLEPVVDTIHIDTEADEFTVLWRARHPLIRSLKEIDAVIIGHGFRLWYQDHITGGSCCGDETPNPPSHSSAPASPVHYHPGTTA